MLARLALASEAEAVVAMAAAHQVEAAPHLSFDADVARRTFHQYLGAANPTILVLEDDDRGRTLIGFVAAYWVHYGFTAGHAIAEEVLYVRPDKRDTPAATVLAKAFDEWAARTAPREIYATTPADPAYAAGVFHELGYQTAGQSLRRVPVAQNG